MIASSGTLSGSGNIWARGGSGVNRCSGGGGGAGGSGGAIRLVANVITGGVNLNFSAGDSPGCNGTYYTGPSSPGYARLEAFDYHDYTGGAGPNLVSFSAPFPVTQANPPQLRITSVAGVAAPALPRGSFTSQPDVVVPSSQANPVTVALQANNIPLGVVLPVTVRPESGAPTTVNSTALAGSEASSTATASVSLPPGLSVISAAVVLDLTTPTAALHPIYVEGERVDRIEVAASYGGASETTYVTHSGRRIKRSE